MAQRLVQTQQQTQRLTPLQLQTIRLVGLPLVELEEAVLHEVEENPALEEDFSGVEDDASSPTEASASDDARLADAEDALRDPDDDPDDHLPSSASAAVPGALSREEIYERTAASTLSLSDHLTAQLRVLSLSDDDLALAEYIIGNLDDAGFLSRTPAEMADDLAFRMSPAPSQADVERVVRLIRTLDPPGVCATSLADCLRLQVMRLPSSPVVDLTRAILEKSFDDLAARHYDALMRRFALSRETLSEVLALIGSLSPRPGSAWSAASPSDTDFILPDFVVDADDEGVLSCSLTRGNLPPLRVSSDYESLLARSSDAEASRFLRRQIAGASEFIEALRRRDITLLGVMNAILSLQHAFFLSGDDADLRPMLLRDVAERSGYDISTVSRAVSGKYALTSFGTLSLKSLFGEGVAAASSASAPSSPDDLTARHVRARLAALIASEDKLRPLSDDALTAMLSAEGITVARRTVAKYREQLGIPTSRLRRTL